MRLIVRDCDTQDVLDALQNVLGAQIEAKIVVLAIETLIPKPEESGDRETDTAAATREALYDAVAKNAQVDANFLVLVVLSTAVAAIGLIRDNVSAVIGAMVIAPLLGPNLALALGTALGDTAMLRRAMKANLAGVVLALRDVRGLGRAVATVKIGRRVAGTNRCGYGYRRPGPRVGSRRRRSRSV